MHVKSNTSLQCNYNNKFLFCLPVKPVLFYAVVYVLSLIEREVQSFYRKDIFAKSYVHFQTFVLISPWFFKMKNDT